MAAEKMGLLTMDDGLNRFVVIIVDGDAFKVDQVFTDRAAAILAATALVTSTTLAHRVWVAGVGDEITRPTIARHAFP